MQKIKDLTIGQMVDTTLVVVSATARETKAKKPYLQLELYDGIDTIPCNYWDWSSGLVPEKNAIVDVHAQVSEYNGTKQLTIKKLSKNTTRHLSEFQPKAEVDLPETYKEAYAMASEVQDEFLRNVALNCLESLQEMWLQAPGAKGVHHAFIGGTLVHSLSVAKLALAMSAQIPTSNDDLCFVGGLLHDIGKLFTYTIDGIAIEMTSEGSLHEHTFIGANFLGNFAGDYIRLYTDELKLEMLQHIILSHHGKLEYGAAVPPMSIEANIVHHADNVDASAQQILEASRKLGNVKFTDRIYTLGNKPQITVQYMKELMSM